MQFLVDNSMYVSLIVALLILAGLIVYLSMIDGRVRKLEREIHSEESRPR
jgi:cell division protein FtsL